MKAGGWYPGLRCGFSPSVWIVVGKTWSVAMMSLKQVSTLALAAVGLAATPSQACPASCGPSDQEKPQASQRHPLVASLASPAGVAIAGTAGLVGLSRLRARIRVVGSAQNVTKPGTTAAFDYPGHEEW